MDVCYLCGNQFNDDTVKRHKEHIIQHAIGGSLEENNILCSSCGNKLGNEIDIPFNKIFNSISTRLDIKKDRKKPNDSTNVVNGKFISGKCQFGNELGEIDVVWKDFKVSPANPFHKYTKENDKVIIYANNKVAKSYRKKVEKEILAKSNENKPEIIVCDDLTGIIKYSFEMNSQAFKKGLAKIAIGFSSKHGISRHDLPLVLNAKSEESTIKDDIPMIQFYPLGVIDNEIEKIKNRMGYFPSHTIIIFTVDTTPKSLVCYIELFSTFQWYIILNDNFHGESIYEYYSQRILKEDEYKFEPGRRYYKERNIVLGDLGISEERITNAFNKQNKEEGNKKSREQVEYEVIQEEYAKQKNKLDFENHISGVVAHVSNIMMSSKEKSFEEIINFKRNFDLFYQIHEDDEIFDISSYRRYFIKDNRLNSYCSALIDNYDKLKKENGFKDYGYKKMAMLEDFIQVEHIKKKIS
jgi:hypothetical protein